MNIQTHPIAIDTSIFLAVIGQSANQLGTSSHHDRDLASEGIQPAKVRASLLAALLSHDLVIPEIVHRQLKSHLDSPRLSQTNQTRLKEIVEHLDWHTTRTIPTRSDLYLQKNAIEALQHRAELHETALGTTDAKFHPVCQLWRHLGHHLPQVRANTDTLDRKTHIHTTEQITLLDFAQIRHRELELNDYEQTPEFTPLDQSIRQILRDFLAADPDGNDHFSRLSPENLEKAPLHIQASSLSTLAEFLAPYLIPEFETLLCAHARQATILTLNRHFHTLQQFLHPLQTLPILDSIPTDLEIPAATNPQPDHPHTTMTIPALSATLRAALAETLATLPDPSPDTDIALLQAVRSILQRIEQGEPDLYDPLHRGDHLALTLAAMD